MIIAPMQSLRLDSPPRPWWTRLVTLLLATLAAASVGYWVLQWPAPAPPLRTAVPDAASNTIDSAQVARLLGAAANSTAPAANPASSYKLLGVIASGSQHGSALIAVDTQPAKPYRVGEHLSENLLLQSVQARRVTLAADAQGTGAVTLELPALPGQP